MTATTQPQIALAPRILDGDDVVKGEVRTYLYFYHSPDEDRSYWGYFSTPEFLLEELSKAWPNSPGKVDELASTAKRVRVFTPDGTRGVPLEGHGTALAKVYLLDKLERNCTW